MAPDSDKRRAAYTGLINGLKTQLENYIRSKSKDIQGIKSASDKLRKYQVQLEEVFQLQIDEAKESEVDPILQRFSLLDLQIEHILTEANDYMKQVSNVLKPVTTSQEIKLPQFNLPSFEGDWTKWHSFWDQFRAAIHSRTDLAPVIKLNYLRGQLKGPAAKLVENFDSIDASYATAVDLLQRTYECPERNIRNTTLKFLGIKNPAHNAEELMEFRADLESNIRALESLGCNIAESGWLITTIVTLKFSTKTLEAIQQKAKVDYPTIDQIRTALLEVINSLTSATGTKPKVKQDDASKSNRTFQTSFESCSVSTAVPNSMGQTDSVKKNSKPVNSDALVGGKGRDPKSDTMESSGNTTFSPTCVFCRENHVSPQCKKYGSFSARKDRLKELGRCTKCVRQHDITQDCHLRICPRCGKGKHHSFLCFAKGTSNNAKQVCTLAVRCETSTALPVVKLHIIRKEKAIHKRALLDTGSQRTFILDTLAKDLGLKPVGKVKLKVEGFLKDGTFKDYDVVNLSIKLGRKYHRLQALLTERLPQNLTVLGIQRVTKHLRNKVHLTDPEIESDHINDLGLLIGMDQYFKVVTGQTRVDNVNLLQTPAGYVIAGNLPSKYKPKGAVNTNVAIVTRINIDHKFRLPSESEELTNLHEEVKNLWELEAIGITDQYDTPDERFVKQHFDNTVQYNNNKYEVRLPWKQKLTKPLPNNYNLCVARTKQTHRKLKVSPGQLEQFGEILDEQLKLGFIEEVLNPQVTDNTHYLPQMRILKDSSTTPMRIVYDCSAKIKSEVSLNECLYKGPSLVEKLNTTLLRFRTNQWAYTADISKAFLRIGLQVVDRDYTRFVWPCNLYDFNSPLKTYRFKSVLFGSTSSPYLLQATLNHHLKSRHSDNPHSEKIKRSLYVDNIQSTIDSEQELLNIYQATNFILRDASMPLKEWTSNSGKLNQLIKVEFPNESVPTDVKLLGITWHRVEDTLTVRSVTWTEVITKRDLLSNAGKIYDPLGLIAPITVPFRMLMQKVWERKIGWDEDLPKEIISEWQELSFNASKVHEFTFPRMTCREGINYNLHIFSDASPKAYGVVAYLTDLVTEPRLLMSRGRVAPLKKRTLPQLELTGIYIASQLASYITAALDQINVKEIHLWSDSEIALQWVLNNKSDIVYVSNRVGQIRENIDLSHIHYVPTLDNPADFLTKEIKAATLAASDLWFSGPEWLNDPTSWPEQKFSNIISCTTVCELVEPLFDIEKYNSLDKVMQITHTVLKVLNKMSRSVDKYTHSYALKYWIKITQQSYFKEEYSYLISKSVETMPELVKNLRLFLKNGLIRSYGRIERSDLPYEAKHPILVPKRCHFTKLMILKSHQQVLHGGVADTLSKIREQYWIPQGRQIVKNVLKTCYICKRLEGQRFALPPTPPLPVERVQNAYPFEVTGVDYSGAVQLNDSSQVDKVYICLFTCAVTRAVHLELAEDLTSETFINIFRRFVARRGCPKIMISDNATNFRSGSEILTRLANEPEVNDLTVNYNVRWKFIPPRSPWHGGFYERMIGLVKGCLRKVLFRRKLSLNDLQTILTEVEARVNNRPLTYQDDSLQQLEPLTPSHLLHGRKLQLHPWNVEDDHYQPQPQTHQSFNQRLTYVNKIIHKWEELWKKEYLLSLRERYPKRGEVKTKFDQSIKIGDIVLIHSDKNREQWPLGRIIELYPDNRGTVRVVKLDSKMGPIIRSVKLLYPLEETLEEITASAMEPDESLNENADADEDNSISEVSDGQANLPTNIAAVPELNLAAGDRATRRAAQRCRAWLQRVCSDELAQL